MANSLNNVAACLLSLGRPAEALPRYEAALEMLQRLFKGDRPAVATDLNIVAYCLQSLGRSAEALLKYEEALEMSQRLFKGDHPDLVTCMNNLADCLDALGRGDEAITRRREALAMRRRLLPSDSLALAAAMAQLGMNLLKQEKYVEAEALLRECLDIREKHEPDAWTTFNSRSLLGEALLGQARDRSLTLDIASQRQGEAVATRIEKFRAAEPLLLAGYQGMKQRKAKIPPQGKARLPEAAERLVRLYEEWDKGEPNTGKAENATEWRVELAAASQPSSIGSTGQRSASEVHP